MPTTKNQIVSKNAVFKPISTIVPGVQYLNEFFLKFCVQTFVALPTSKFLRYLYISARLAYVVGVIVAVFITDSFCTECKQPK